MLLIRHWFFMLVLFPPPFVWGHGYLLVPPGRNSMWREGFPNPINFDDNELYCGGAQVQWQQNEGKCGVCGDPWNQRQPRNHEAGGTYANGIIVRRYSPGQTMNVVVRLTSNHWGFFELHLCPNNDPAKAVTEECLKEYPLRVEGTTDAKFHVPLDSKKDDIFAYRVILPSFITCTQCVLRWKYTTGNTWGTCPNGTEGLGCGPQETFVNCADIGVHTNTGGFPPGFENYSHVDNPHLLYYKNSSLVDAPYIPLVINHQVCVSRNSYLVYIGMDEYCRSHCMRYPPSCPRDMCFCPRDCWAIGDIAGKPGADQYCMDKCLVSSYRKSCRPDRCKCN